MKSRIEGLVTTANRVINSVKVDNFFANADYDLSEGLRSEFERDNREWTAVLLSTIALKLRANNSWGNYALRISKGYPVDSPQELFEEIYPELMNELMKRDKISKEISIPYKRYTTIRKNNGDFSEIPEKYFDDGNIVKIEDGYIKVTIVYIEHKFGVYIDKNQEFNPDSIKYMLRRHELMPGAKEIVMNLPLEKKESGKFYIPTEINLWDIELEEVFDNKEEVFDNK